MLAIIPARGGSKRLPGKNIYPVLGKPMIQWVIEAAQASSAVTDIVVSSDSEEILSIARDCNVQALPRSSEMSGDAVFTQAVLMHVVGQVNYMEQHLCCLQANSPEITAKIIDGVADLFIRTKRHDVRTCNPDGVSNGAIWMMKTGSLFSEWLSQYMGFYETDMVDVHKIEDIAVVEARLRQRQAGS